MTSHLAGIAAMIRASIAFSLMALLVKLASATLPSLEVVFFRSVIGTLMIVAVMLAKKIPVWGTQERGLMILRGVSGFLALTLNFYTIAHLPLGTAMMLNYTGPIFAALFAILFLKEHPSLRLLTMTLVSFIGVALLVSGKIATLNTAVFLALLSAVFVGIVFVSIRAIRGRESVYTIIFYFTAVSTVGSLAFIPFGFRWPNLYEWALLSAIGVGTFFGQLWMTRALILAPASLVSPFGYVTPLLSFVYGWIFFGEKVTAVSIVGGLLIILGGCAISYWEAREPQEKLPPTIR